MHRLQMCICRVLASDHSTPLNILIHYVHSNHLRYQQGSNYNRTFISIPFPLPIGPKILALAMLQSMGHVSTHELYKDDDHYP